VLGGGLRSLHGTATVPNAVRQPIVFVTDYGRDDAYAAALTGAAWRVDPHALCVDGTHGIPAGDVLAGAYQLKALALAFADGAVFCAVVDPGVGTDRRAIAIDIGRIRCVAPDNGLISYLWDETETYRSAVSLDVPLDAAPTFHGRDVFAPIAAQLALGGRLDAAGERIDDPIVLADAFAEWVGTGLQGRVCVVDHFGNAITTIRDADIGSSTVRSVSWQGGASAGLVTTYADIEQGAAALIGSAGHLEVAARGLPVAAVGGPKLGDAVFVELG
jgi:S-adenosylmethionine hydrolase